MSIVEVPVSSLEEVDDWIKRCAGSCFELPLEVFDYITQGIIPGLLFQMQLGQIRGFIQEGRVFTCPAEKVHRIYTGGWPFAHRWFVESRAHLKAAYRFVLGSKGSLPFMSLGV